MEIGKQPLTRPHHRLGWFRSLFGVNGIVALCVLLPIITIIGIALFPRENIWPELIATVLPRYTLNTLLLMLTVGGATGVLGTILAFFVTHVEFAGRKWLQYAVLLPLAMPGYVAAFALVDFFEYAGPIQTWLRSVFGWERPTDYWFPNIRSFGGAAVVLTLTLYPYVYLFARASFKSQGVAAENLARSLGENSWRIFWRVSLPLARPGIFAGMAIVMMETVNDFGTVEFFAVQTLTTGSFSTWLETYNAGGAAQLACLLLALVATLVFLEQQSRKRAGHYRSSKEMRVIAPKSVGWVTTLLAGLICALACILGFVVPFAILSSHATFVGFMNADVIISAFNSFWLGIVTALIVVPLAFWAVFKSARAGQGTASTFLRIARFGYAVPGAVLGLGVLLSLSVVDHTLANILEAVLGGRFGLLLTGTSFALIFAYTARFFAVGLGAADTGLSALSKNTLEVAGTLGQNEKKAFVKVVLPLTLPAMASAAVLVFVDTVKELPATLLLRPFGFNTLATGTYQKASLEDLTMASSHAIIIVCLALFAVILLVRTNR